MLLLSRQTWSIGLKFTCDACYIESRSGRLCLASQDQYKADHPEAASTANATSVTYLPDDA